MKRKYLASLVSFIVVLLASVLICGTASSVNCPPLQRPCFDNCCDFWLQCCGGECCSPMIQKCCGDYCCNFTDKCCDGLCCASDEECIDGMCYCASDFIYGKGSMEVELLRTFRDEVLRPSPVGQEIIELYYKWSPVIVKTMKEDEEFKEEIKGMIDGVLELIAEEVE